MAKTDAQAINEINSELDDALEKFPTWPSDPFHALAVVSEEHGELAQALLHYAYENKGSLSYIRKEAVQLAAVSIRLVMSLDEYHPQASEQHAQPQ